MYSSARNKILLRQGESVKTIDYSMYSFCLAKDIGLPLFFKLDSSDVTLCFTCLEDGDAELSLSNAFLLRGIF